MDMKIEREKIAQVTGLELGELDAWISIEKQDNDRPLGHISVNFGGLLIAKPPYSFTALQLFYSFFK